MATFESLRIAYPDHQLHAQLNPARAAPLEVKYVERNRGPNVNCLKWRTNMW